jgi:hypothetical protein
MNRTDIINFYTAKFTECAYLEVGVGNLSANFVKIKAADKSCVDPCTQDATYKMKSDDFFFNNRRKYDVIFIDGDHRAIQVIEDIHNALNCITAHGIILLHDCNPLLEIHQRDEIVEAHWNGSVWKAVLFYRMMMPSINIQTVDVDEGIGIIKPFMTQQLFMPDMSAPFEPDFFFEPNFFCAHFNFDFLNKYRRDILNLITVEEWKAMENVDRL